jgi:WD40 repeat protein
VAFKFLTSLDADDIFISYSRTDGAAYVTGLEAALSAKEFSCFTDRLGTDSDPLPPKTLFRKIRVCKTLVLLATPGAVAKPENIAREVSEFAEANGTSRIVCVSFDRDEEIASWSTRIPWYAYVEGKAREREDPKALKTGEPSPSIVDAIVAASNYMKSKDRLRRYRNRALAGLMSLLGISVIAGGFAAYQFEQAGKAMADARMQSGIAESRSLANRSQVLLRQRPGELPDALSLAVDAMKKSVATGVHTVEADTALRDNLAILPLLQSSYKYGGPGDLLNVAFSPDARHFAILSTDKMLRIYESVSQAPFKERKPVKELRCDCSAIALSSEPSYAAAVVKGGVQAFSLKDDAQSHLIKLEDNVTVNNIALSPGARYLTLSFDHGKDAERLSKLMVVEIKKGGAIKTFNDLNMLINDIEFGASGNLVIGGRYGGAQGFGRIVIWPLPLKLSGSGVEPDLTDASFESPQIISQQREVHAVAAGTDSTYFATGDGVWKRQSGGTDYRIAARLPYVRDFPSNSSVEKLAFASDGLTLILARVIDARDQNQNDYDQSVLEVWGMPPHQDVMHVFYPKEVTSVGFKPEEPFIVTMTGPPTMEKPAHVLRARTGEQVGSISLDPEPKDRKVRSVSADGRYFVYTDDSVAIVWDVWKKRKVPVLFGNILKDVEVTTVSPGGKFLALSGLDSEGKRSLVVYRAEGHSYQVWKSISQNSDELRAVAIYLSADGKRLAAHYSYAERFVRVWDVGLGYDVSPDDLKSDNAGDIVEMVLSTKGRFIALTDWDHRTQLLDLSGGQNAKLRSLLENTSIISIAFSPDERYLGLGSEDGIVHVFDTLRPDDEIATLVHTGRIKAIAFSNDSRYMATTSSDPHPSHTDENESYPMRVWLLQPADLIAEAERRLAPFRNGLPGDSP